MSQVDYAGCATVLTVGQGVPHGCAAHVFCVWMQSNHLPRHINTETMISD